MGFRIGEILKGLRHAADADALRRQGRARIAPGQIPQPAFLLKSTLSFSPGCGGSPVVTAFRYP